MNVSYALVKLSSDDILGIIEEFVAIDGLKIEKIDIKDIITIKGCYSNKVSINFNLSLGVGAVNKDEIIIKILKLKVGGIRIAISFIHLIFKRLLSSFVEYGITIKDKHIVINLKKIQELIPVTNFTINSVKIRNNYIECEGEDIRINIEKEYKTIEKINEEFENENLRKQLMIKDLYSKFRYDIEKKIPQKVRDNSSYILLIPDFITLIIRLFKDKRVHIKDKIFLGTIVTYLLSPIDVIPDFFPGIGSIDDVYIIFYAIEKIIKNIPQEIILDNWEGDAKTILNSTEIIKDVFQCLGVKNSKNLFKYVMKKVFSKKTKKKKDRCEINGKSICS